MKKLIVLLIILVTVILQIAFGQTGTIKGTIKDKQTGEAVPFANIYIEIDSVKVGTVSDTLGKYSIKSIPQGTSDLHVNYLGYNPAIVNGVIIRAGKITFVDVSIDESYHLLPCVEIVRYKIPLIDKEGGSSVMRCSSASIVSVPSNSYHKRKRSRRVTKSELSKMPGRSISGISVTEGVYSQEGDVRSVRGSNTESYDVITENTFKDVKSEPLSTFSTDVDKASYANVRRFISNSEIPNKDAVRIEEMINYFNYDYPQPTGNDAFSINMEMGDCPWNNEHQLLKIGLKGKIPVTEEIPPANLVFLIDVSGSMNSYNKLPLLKKAFSILIDKLRPEDRVAIVVYAGSTGCVLNSTTGDNKKQIKDALNNLEAGGSTAGGQGINLAYKIAEENFLKEGNNRVILATDGDFNIGASSDAQMVRLIEEKRKSGVSLSILGFGMGNYKDSKMEQISNAGNGNYSYIDNILEAKKVLGVELWGTLYTIAKDVKIQIEFNPSKIKSYRLIGYENRILNNEDFNDDTKDAGDIGAGHTVTALYEITSSNSKEEIALSVDTLEYQINRIIPSENLMTVKLRYKDPKEDVSKLIIKKVVEDEVYKNINSEDFNFAVAVASFGMILKESKYKGSAQYNSVIKIAKHNKGKDDEGYRAEFIRLVEQAELIDERYTSK